MNRFSDFSETANDHLANFEIYHSLARAAQTKFKEIKYEKRFYQKHSNPDFHLFGSLLFEQWFVYIIYNI